jgi:DNA-binding HxlR family transcriptional regulator
MLGGMRHASLAAVPCPIARTLDVVGEWWTLLLIRDALLGARKFEEFRSSGIADNILTARLKKLTAAGIFERHRYQTRPERYEYLLTDRGRELAPVIFALRSWGRRWTTGPDSSDVRHERCGGAIKLVPHCTTCDREIPKHEITIAPLPPDTAASA